MPLSPQAASITVPSSSVWVLGFQTQDLMHMKQTPLSQLLYIYIPELERKESLFNLVHVISISLGVGRRVLYFYEAEGGV